MSTCVSREGEYSDHETGDWCPRCGAFNEEAIVAERDALRATVTAAVAELDKIEDRAPHDIDGMIYTIPWAEGVIAGSKRVRRILTTGSAVQDQTNEQPTARKPRRAALGHSDVCAVAMRWNGGHCICHHEQEPEGRES